MKDKLNNEIGPRAGSQKVFSQSRIIGLLAILVVFISFAAATQYFAYRLNYQAILGKSYHNIYLPWQIINWFLKWGNKFPELFKQAGSIGILVAASGFAILLVVKMLWSNSLTRNRYLHGSARWANKKDILQSGLLNNEKGVYVGAWEDRNRKIRYLRHSGPEHVLTYAPTRSGKGVGLVIPTLLSWAGSAVITDLKGELWAMTAGWRKQYAGNKVIRFEPASLYGSACWNPLDEIRLGTEYEVGDVQNLATLIVDKDGKGLHTHWQKTSQALLVGLILHILYKRENERCEATLSEVDKMLTDPNLDIEELWEEMMEYQHSEEGNNRIVYSAARDMVDRPEQEAGSVLSTVKSDLSLYRDPVVAKNISKSDFKIKDLMFHDNPVSLYIITQPNDKTRLKPLIGVLVDMIVRLLADKMEFEKVEGKNSSLIQSKKHYKHQLLGMFDEFPALGKLEILQESLAFIAGYGIKFYLICQDINQLKSRENGYGPDETITSNCHVQNAYPPNRPETAEYLSKLTGQTTITTNRITTSGKRISALLPNISRTTQEVQRPLLTVDECLRMKTPQKDAQGKITEAGDMVIYVAGLPAIYGKQPLYFDDPIFVARAAIEAPDQTDRINVECELSHQEKAVI